ncbi:UNVERIFIED_CONTAM: hypothetical protein Slati_4026300 [Sesamum latifolium]|uniref:Uncharacterized protein n=1 Tax=Sesamum latifolium TaxID=2727402 RepID=A0AAW2TR78_9LAMI
MAAELVPSVRRRLLLPLQVFHQNYQSVCTLGRIEISPRDEGGKKSEPLYSIGMTRCLQGTMFTLALGWTFTFVDRPVRCVACHGRRKFVGAGHLSCVWVLGKGCLLFAGVLLLMCCICERSKSAKLPLR